MRGKVCLIMLAFGHVYEEFLGLSEEGRFTLKMRTSFQRLSSGLGEENCELSTCIHALTVAVCIGCRYNKTNCFKFLLP